MDGTTTSDAINGSWRPLAKPHYSEIDQETGAPEHTNDEIYGEGAEMRLRVYKRMPWLSDIYYDNFD